MEQRNEPSTVEIVRVNNENTRLQRKVERLSRLLEAAERETRAANGGTAV